MTDDRAALPGPGDFPTSALSDVMDRFGVAAGIRPLWTGAAFSGPAATVQTRPGDNKGVHAALETVRRGEILVVDGGGETGRALIGELIVQKARALQLGAIVLDGAARDCADLAELGVPVFARAVCPAGPWKDGPYRTGVPIAVGGTVVRPGDWVSGDADGVVVVPAERVTEVVAAAGELLAGEAEKRAANSRLVPRV